MDAAQCLYFCKFPGNAPRESPNPGRVLVSKTLQDMTAIRKYRFQKHVVHLFFAGLARDGIMVVANTTAAHQNESFGGLRLGPT